jgi:hypothetical protein
VFAYSNRNWDERALVLYNNSYYETSGWVKQSSPAIPQADGSLRQDTLTEALSIHGEDRYFTFFHEQRSGLWFIRSSKELSERGLFVSLRGYEAQVFLDIHEREDGLGGPWARRWSSLHHHLEGRGVPDPDAAAADLFLDALYRPFTEIFAPQQVQALEAAVESANAGALASLLKEFMAPILDFTEAALEYLDGADGTYEPFVYPGLDPADATRKAAAATCALGQFSAFLERLIGAGPVVETRRRECTAYALGYAALTLPRVICGLSGKAALALLDHWQLGRKLRECFRDLGLNTDESWRVVELMKALLVRTCPESVEAGPTKTKAGPSESEAAVAKPAAAKPRAARPNPLRIPAGAGVEAWAATLIAENYQADDFRRLLGLNRFNDITWFNKEAFEESLAYLSCFLLIEDEAALGPLFAAALGTTERAAFIAEFNRVMLKAEEGSGYRLDELIKALSTS